MLKWVINDTINLPILYDECLIIEDKIIKEWSKDKEYKKLAKDVKNSAINYHVKDTDKHPEEFTCDSISANMHPTYNVFDDKAKDNMLLLKNFVLQKFVEFETPPAGTYHIHAWITVLRGGQSMGEHYHRLGGERAWHGYFCVNTEFEYPDWATEVYNDQILENKNGMLAMEETFGGFHKKSVWNSEPLHRVTISFDVFQNPIEGLTFPFEVV